MRGRSGDIGAVEFHPPRMRSMGSGERTQERGLAGAVGADQRDRFAFRDLQRYAPDGLEKAVTAIEIGDAEQRHAFPPR